MRLHGLHLVAYCSLAYPNHHPSWCVSVPHSSHTPPRHKAQAGNGISSPPARMQGFKEIHGTR